MLTAEATGDEERLLTSQVKYRRLNEEYERFSKGVGLRTQTERMYVEGFTPKHGKAAARSYKDYIAKSKESGIINKRITQSSASAISKKISDGEYNIKLSEQQFLKHTKDTAQFENYKNSRIRAGGNPQSVLTVDYETAQKIISEKAGTGIVRVDKKGNPRPVEDINCGIIIGQYFGGGEYHDTVKASIHYGKKGSHIVPIRGDNFD